MYNPYQYQTPIQFNPYLNQPQQQQVQSNNNSITWVQGEAGAKAYPVAAGTSILLMDSEGEHFYIKSTDSSGMPQPLRVFKYKEVVENQQPEISPVAQSFDSSQFVTRDEFERRINELNRRNTNYSRHKEDKDEK